MKEIITKTGVILTTYNQKEIDYKIDAFLEKNDSDGCAIFLDNIKSFNPKSEHYITIEEVKKLVGLERKKNYRNPKNLYTNYKGMPLGLGIMGVSLYFEDPMLSLKSAFERAIPKFDFEKDFFHICIL